MPTAWSIMPPTAAKPRARTETVRNLGIPDAEMDARLTLMLMVRRVKMDYVPPAMLDDPPVIETQTPACRRQVGEPTAPLRQIAYSHVGVDATYGCRSPASGVPENKPAGIPPRWRAAMQASRTPSARGATTYPDRVAR